MVMIIIIIIVVVGIRGLLEGDRRKEVETGSFSEKSK